MIALAECAAHSGKPPHIEKEIGKRREQRLKSWNIVNCGSSFGKMSIYIYIYGCGGVLFKNSHHKYRILLCPATTYVLV